VRSLLSARLVVSAAAVLAAVLCLAVAPHAPVSAAAANTSASSDASDSSEQQCTVTSASITWGFKESFRSYISGSIARGSWEAIDGATYTTPSFEWAGGTGTVAADGTAATVAFPGGIRFTGHDGLLDTTIAHPTLEVTPGGVRLLLDVAGVSMDHAMAGDPTVDTVTQAPFVTVDVAAVQQARAGDLVTISAVDAATAVTEEGFAAFGSYPAGTAFDPLTFTVTAQCAAPTAPAAPADTAAAAPEPTHTSDAALVATRDTVGPGGVIATIVGAIVVAAAGTGAVFFIRRRREGARDGRA